MDKKFIRNFCIIAHIDHGKSTLSDRIIELTNSLSKREMRDQILDTMDLEKERGITIKLNAVQLKYKFNNDVFFLNLIDTPGHVDFTYEVSRSLAACEGAILVVDASQGIESQTLSNVYLALENNLEIIPIINKIDLPTANPDFVKKQIEDVIGLDCSDIPMISAKTGLNVDKVLEAIIGKILPPKDNLDNNSILQALLFDSFYDKYRGVVCLVRIKNGILKVGDKIKFFSNNAEFIVTEVGVNTPKPLNKNILISGEVGWFSAAIKDIKLVHIGDTITSFNNPCLTPLPGYKKIIPMVFCGLFPIDTSQFEFFKESIMKISLSDASLIYEYENSQALGFGIRCGFLGLLHMDIIKERLFREFNIDLISSPPSVMYKILMTNGEILNIDSASKLPDKTYYKEIQEPYINLEINVTNEFVGNVMELCQNNRGQFISIDNIFDDRKKIIYSIPLAEIMYSFFDKLKSCSKGYASMNYELSDYKKGDLVKVDFLLNGTKIDALSMIVHRDFATFKARNICIRLKELIPKKQFEIPIQAVIGGKIIARETIKSLYKNVLSKCYGGDITRKKKLLEQQKEGKKKLKAIGNVDVPHDIFIKVLSGED